MKQRPSDRVVQTKAAALSEHDRRRLIKIRQQYGAIELSIRVYARPAGTSRTFNRINSATKSVTVYSAMNAEQVINGGPIAGLNFAATVDLLELYETEHAKETK